MHALSIEAVLASPSKRLAPRWGRQLPKEVIVRCPDHHRDAHLVGHAAVLEGPETAVVGGVDNPVVHDGRDLRDVGDRLLAAVELPAHLRDGPAVPEDAADAVL